MNASEPRGNPNAEVMTAADVAALFQCSERHVRQMVTDGFFPRGIILGRCVRWERAFVLKWLRRHRGCRVPVGTVERAGKIVEARG
jgi:predicted DNA-binding transcriptional regulator AlpA